MADREELARLRKCIAENCVWPSAEARAANDYEAAIIHTVALMSLYEATVERFARVKERGAA